MYIDDGNCMYFFVINFKSQFKIIDVTNVPFPINIPFIVKYGITF